MEIKGVEMSLFLINFNKLSQSAFSISSRSIL